MANRKQSFGARIEQYDVSSSRWSLCRGLCRSHKNHVTNDKQSLGLWVWRLKLCLGPMRVDPNVSESGSWTKTFVLQNHNFEKLIFVCFLKGLKVAYLSLIGPTSKMYGRIFLFCGATVAPMIKRVPCRHSPERSDPGWILPIVICCMSSPLSPISPSLSLCKKNGFCVIRPKVDFY